MTDIAELALKDRVCDATDRIPAARWPFFSQTLTGIIPNLGTSVDLTLEAERDLLLTDLSISVVETDTPDVEVPAHVDIEYCNVTYAEHTDVGVFGYCCQRKPIFLVGVRENKKLKFTVTLEAAADEENTVQLTVSGYQGDGCCS